MYIVLKEQCNSNAGIMKSIDVKLMAAISGIIVKNKVKKTTNTRASFKSPELCHSGRL